MPTTWQIPGFGGPSHSTEDFVSALLLRRLGPKDQSSSQFVRIRLAVLLNKFDTAEGWEKEDNWNYLTHVFEPFGIGSLCKMQRLCLTAHHR